MLDWNMFDEIFNIINIYPEIPLGLLNFIYDLLIDNLKTIIRTTLCPTFLRNEIKKGNQLRLNY